MPTYLLWVITHKGCRTRNRD